MILTVDIGNTNIVYGIFDGDKAVFESRMDTDKNRMADQYAVTLAQLFSLYSLKTEQIDGAVISSVVPPVADQLKAAVKRVFGVEPVMVGAGVKTGLNILIDDPSTLGADLACGGAAAKELYPLPCIVIDLGTASKVYAVNKDGAFIGGIIAPGIKISLEALASGTMSLPMISLEGNAPVIGTNTVDCMRSGILYGHAGMLDNFIDRFQERLGKSTVVVTGGFGALIKDYCRNDFILDRQLVLKGLKIIYDKNSRNTKK
ncbi:MAG TPA: type III pantothenate kinase [Ruminococcaceae bacterium]|nr:type III pantothenate kinase [Oscillospiraceae bacterium]